MNCLASDDDTIYTNHFILTVNVPAITKQPSPAKVKSDAQNLLRPHEWKMSIVKLSKSPYIPIPVGHNLPRFQPTQKNPNAPLDDLSVFRRLKRQFNLETFPPSLENQLALEDISINGGEINIDSNSPPGRSRLCGPQQHDK
jgi:hypothetical protein